MVSALFFYLSMWNAINFEKNFCCCLSGLGAGKNFYRSYENILFRAMEITFLFILFVHRCVHLLPEFSSQVPWPALLYAAFLRSFVRFGIMPASWEGSAASFFHTVSCSVNRCVPIWNLRWRAIYDVWLVELILLTGLYKIQTRICSHGSAGIDYKIITG